MNSEKRVLVFDYGGYPYPYQLSEWLANNGCHVLHMYNLSEPPRGITTVGQQSRGNLRVEGIQAGKDFGKEQFLKRRQAEIQFGRHLVRKMSAFQPDWIISANSPVETQFLLMRAARGKNIPFLFWVQDLRGYAASCILPGKIPILGSLIGWYYLWLERLQIRWSDHAVLITEGFRPFVDRWASNPAEVSVIPNWAPLESLPVLPKENSWSKEFAINQTFNFLFAGVLGMKHNPELLLKLALHYRGRDDVRVVVVSRGPGVDWLKKEKYARGLEQLILIDFQPFELMPKINAAGDVLLSILEPEAGLYSVPSKVQTYMCGGKPLLLSVPEENLIARVVREQEAGMVVSPGDVSGWITKADHLLGDADLRDRYGKNARRYAERHFNIDLIGKQFMKIIAHDS